MKKLSHLTMLSAAVSGAHLLRPAQQQKQPEDRGPGPARPDCSQCHTAVSERCATLQDMVLSSAA